MTGVDGRAVSVSLYAQDGAIGLGRLTDRGQMDFEALRRIRTLFLGRAHSVGRLRQQVDLIG